MKVNHFNYVAKQGTLPYQACLSHGKKHMYTTAFWLELIMHHAILPWQPMLGKPCIPHVFAHGMVYSYSLLACWHDKE